jgi:DNA polymerase I-like protein with 3'-5' exonuclease and polymerase domains
MNLPKEPGVRECYVPRPGFVFCSVDYEALELHTLAQACLQLVGHSKLAEALNSGIDPHLALACEHLLEGVEYDEGKKIRKDEKHPRYKEVVHARNTAKAANFGLPGGLGIRTLVAFCKASGIEIAEEQASDLKQAWLRQWPEMRDYFRMISNSLCMDEEGEEVATVEQLYSARVRGKTRYTAACNSFFQGLAADLAKEACYQIAKACYVKGYNPILYGSRSVVFVHDEIIMEHPEGTAHERALEQARIMIEAGKAYCPDVPLKAEPALMRYWTKDAVEVYKDGRLVPWEKAVD